MAKIGSMPGPTLPTAPLAGVPHFATKLATPPKARQNTLNVRVAPMKRLEDQTPPIKPSSPGNNSGF
jgi:hypothetical protein